MKRHMTQMELTKTRKMIEAGVVEIPVIQQSVFCHAESIQTVLDTYDIEKPEPAPAPKPKAVKKVVEKAAKKKPGAAAQRLAEKSGTDPLS